MKKRILVLALIAAMVFQQGFSTSMHAMPNENQNAKASEILNVNQRNITSSEKEIENANQDMNFEVKLSLAFPITKDGTIDKDFYQSVQMYLKKGTENKSGSDRIDLSVSSFHNSEVIYTAQGVESGQYTLYVETNQYYRSFQQEVTIEDGMLHTVYLSDVYTINQKDSDKNYGIVAIGDFNQDGAIDQDDVDQLKLHMGQSKTSSHSFDETYDLNKDGIIDIVDMSIVAHNFNINEDVKGVISQSVLPSQVEVAKQQENTEVVGERKLETIMEEQEQPIALQTSNQGVISQSNPVKVEMNFKNTNTKIEGMRIKAPQESGPTNGTILVSRADREEVMEIPIVSMEASTQARTKQRATAIRKADGTIDVNLGDQIAVKKITIVVTASASSTNLTEIAKVEFLNDMENRIPEPELNIPQNIQVQGKGKELYVKWDAEPNVTGYEVRIYAVDKEGNRVPKTGYNTYHSGLNELKIEKFSGGVKDQVTSLWTYYVSVRSTNGTWASPYSEEVEHYQKPAGVPAAPDNVSVNGKYRQLDVSWKDMEETEYYTLGYREKGTEEYTEIHDIQRNNYSITNLKDNKEYEIYVYGWNTDENDQPRHGAKSLPAIGKTILDLPQFPKYKMINHPKAEGGLSDHIVSVKSIAQKAPGGPGGIDYSQYPDGIYKDEYLVDGDYTTYMHTNLGYPNGAEVTFDKEYTFKEIIMTNRLEEQYRDGLGYSQVIMEFYDKNGALVKSYLNNVEKTSLHPTGKNSIRFTIPEPVTAQKVVFKLSKYSAGFLTISELNFFEYDSLEDDVYALFEDDMHVTLKDGVSEDMIEELERRANIKDEISQEYHPKKDVLLAELENARQLLLDQEAQQNLIDVNPNITLKDTNNSQISGGLSGLQPLGYVASADQTIHVYVGQKGKVNGEVVDASLIFTQYHGESSAWKSKEIALKQGLNEIQVPTISSLDFEKGGSIYVQHNSKNLTNNPIQIRVSGATKIPTLDLHRMIGEERQSVDETAWKEEITRYVQELKTYVETLEEHHEAHESTVKKDYDPRNCFLNATEIGLDNVLMSVAASEVYQALTKDNDGSIETMTQNMYDNVLAMNQLVELFYKQRGFQPANVNGKHGIPTGRFNIRYQRMFAGAFMYAGGNHLGIEFDSIQNVASGKPVQTDANGKYVSGSLYGWGIAHEMGHNADVAGVSVAELTNNIWSQFATTKDTADTSRIPYSEVYQKVTSNTVGRSGSVFAQLGMFWQLHLAYDNHYVHYDYYANKDTQNKQFTEENYQAMLNGEFFARYYAIRRDYSLAPNNGVAYTNHSSSFEQNVMRTASAAAQKDLTDFFKAWGYIPDEQTSKYMQQFEKETRQIQYLNDAAREYTLAKGQSVINANTQVQMGLEQGSGIDAKKVTLTLSLPEGIDHNGVLGYEILRNNQPVAFVEPAKDENGAFLNETIYTDVIGSENNRVMTYSVRVYDKYLNVSNTTTLDPIKIAHDGELPRDQWTVTSNAVSNRGVLHLLDTNENQQLEVGTVYRDVVTKEAITYQKDMDVAYLDVETGEVNRMQSGANVVLDGDLNTQFSGTGTSDHGVYIDLNLNAKQTVIGLKFKKHSEISNQPFELWVSENGIHYSKVSFRIVEGNDGYSIAYFAGAGTNLKGITMTNIRFVSPWKNYTISASELSLIGQSGDNIDLAENQIGILDQDYPLDESNYIPKGSFVVVGNYTGNAAYNAVKLFNQNYKMYDESVENQLNSIVNGYQVFFASMPDSGNIVDVKDGSWIFWLEPLENGKFGLPMAGENGEDVVVELPETIYAQLYRVDNATTLENERFVSDSFQVNVPKQLPTISLEHNSVGSGPEVRQVQTEAVEEKEEPSLPIQENKKEDPNEEFLLPEQKELMEYEEGSY